ncbi:MAG: 30S ribosomal protein S7 [Candidatus Methanofastidiosia archaeon]
MAEEILWFDRWDTNIEVLDEGLKNYINLTPILLPHTAGRHEKVQFWKNKLTIVERLMNKLMRTGSPKRKIAGRFIRRQGGLCGKKHRTFNIVREAFEIIAEKTSKNPLQVLIRAIENSAPREGTTTITYGGVSYHQSVDISPQRRLDSALKYLAIGASAKCFKNKMSFAGALASEIMLAATSDNKSLAVAKKEEVERIAKSAR